MSDKEYKSDKEYVANIPNLSNKKLIDGLEWCGHDSYYNVMYYPIIKEIKKRLSKERKTGRWIEDETGYGYWTCSACGFVTEASAANILYHFCPNCGADLRLQNT